MLGVCPLKLLLLSLSSLVLLSCQALAATPLPDPPSPPRLTPSTPPAGRLAYIGGDGNVYVTTPDLTSKIAVTRDATAPAEYPGYSYHRLSWSPDGRLAFAGVTRAAGETRSVLYVVDTPGGSAQVVGRSDEHFVIYIYWSPAPCPERPDCRRLAYLIEEGESISLRLVEMSAGVLENRFIGAGWPFYFSWSADGRQLLWHTGGARRYNAAAQLALYQVEENRLEILPHLPGLFVAPAWSPQGEGWLGVSAEAKMDQLQHFGSGEPATLARYEDGQIVFAWSPQGDQVAYAVRQNSSDPFYGPIEVVNLRTGEARRVTERSRQILGFFWSPDGRRLGYLTYVPLFDSIMMQWRVVELAGGQDRGFAMFHPSFQMDFMVSSFNQYAQSDRFWSPDGRYLVYADRDPSLVERVWLIDTGSEEGVTTLVDTGAIGLWSWN